MIPLQFALRRRMMMAGGSLLPSGFTLLAWIKGTGTQYIDTGFVVNKSDNYVLEIDGLFPSQAQVYQGCNGYMQFFTSSKYGISGDSSVAVGNRNTVRVEYANQTEKFFVDGAQIESKLWSAYNGSNVKLALLRMGDANNGWYNGAAAQGTIYGYKVWKNNILVSECVPCIRNSDGAAGVYDVIREQFITPVNGVFLTPDGVTYTVTTNYIPVAGLVTVNGLDLPVSNSTTIYTVPSGATIILRARSESTSQLDITVDDVVVASASPFQSVSYAYAVTKNCTVHVSNSAAGQRSWITT